MLSEKSWKLSARRELARAVLKFACVLVRKFIKPLTMVVASLSDKQVVVGVAVAVAVAVALWPKQEQALLYLF